MRNDRYHDNPNHVHAIDIRTVARLLGGDMVGRNAVLAPGPHHSPRDRSLSVKLVGSEVIVHSFAGDDWQTCKDFVRERLGWPRWEPGDGRNRCVEPADIKAFDRDRVNLETEIRERTPDDLNRIARAVAIWNEAKEPRGTLAERYLASRALKLTDDLAGSTLRYHKACPWRDEDTGATVFVPCLIAAFRSVDDDAVVAVHRIRTDQGPKPQRRMLGLVHRSAVKLGPANGALHVGEGIETCMAAGQLGYAPAWAAGSAGAIAHFPLIHGVERLRLLGERDEANAGAVKLCAQRWHAAGRRVQIGLPRDGHTIRSRWRALHSG
jgi:hypothetical protein